MATIDMDAHFLPDIFGCGGLHPNCLVLPLRLELIRLAA